jgi:hypothetical protein
MKKSIMPTAMAGMSLEDLLKKLVENQAERENLFEALKGVIMKKTEGAASFKDDNANVPKYWLKVAQDYADDLLPRNFDLADFALKALCFEDVVATRKDEATVTIGLNLLRNIISQDAYWYAMYVMKQVKDKAAKNPVYRKLLQDAPVIRVAKSDGPKDPPPTDPPTAK